MKSSRFKFVAMELPSKAFIYFSVLRERKYKLIWPLCGYRRIGLWMSETGSLLQGTGTVARYMIGLKTSVSGKERPHHCTILL